MNIALIAYRTGTAAALMLAAGAQLAAAQPLPVAPVEYRDVDTTYSTEAVVEAVRQSTISAQGMGRVVELRADVGDFVKAGQVVARIDEREAAQVVASSGSRQQRQQILSRQGLQQGSNPCRIKTP